MKYLFTLFGFFIFNSLIAQPTVLEWELNQYKQKGDRVKHQTLPIGYELKIGEIYSWKSSDGMYWDWAYGKLVDINDNKYLLENYPYPGLKQISKVKFKDLHTVDTVTNKPITPKNLNYVYESSKSLYSASNSYNVADGLQLVGLGMSIIGSLLVVKDPELAQAALVTGGLCFIVHFGFKFDGHKHLKKSSEYLELHSKQVK